MMIKKEKNQKIEALFLAIKWTYKGSPLLTIGIFLISIFGGLLAIVEPYLFKIIIDKLISQRDVQGFALSILAILFIYGITRFLQSSFWDITNGIRKTHAMRIEREATHALMKNISSLDIGYFEDPKYYNLLVQANQNLWRIFETFYQITFFLNEFISAGIIIAALAVYDIRLVFIILIGSIPSVILSLKTSDALWSAFTEGSPIFKQVHYYRNLLTEKKEAIKEIQLFGANKTFLNRYYNLFSQFLSLQDKAVKKQVAGYLLIGLLEGVTSVLAAYLVVQAFVINKITVGELTFLWALLFQFAGHARWLTRMINDTYTNVTFLKPIVAVLHFKPLILEPVHPKLFPKEIKKGIEFRNVSFTYPRTKKIALKNVSFTINAKESTALVGENGSGKTTIIKLFCRFYDVTEGEILIDGINIKEFALADLRNNIGVIFQDFVKYESTVEENIRLHGKGNVHESAKKSGAWNFIKEFEKKYKTQLGRTLEELGVELSGGEWQKIALARAFYKNASILIL